MIDEKELNELDSPEEKAEPTGASNIFEARTDPELEKNGVWVKWPSGSGEFKIASFSSPNYRRLLNKLVAKRSQGNSRWADNIEGQLEVTIAAVARHILVDWKGEVIIERGGASVPYSYENACKALKIRPFREWVEQQAFKNELFKEQEKATQVAALKSSAPVEPEV